MEQNQLSSGELVRESRSAVAGDDLDGFYGLGKAWMLWDDKGAWKIREGVEGCFYADLLRKHHVHSVIDVSAASGFHAITLARAGFVTAATDGFDGFVEAGERNVRESQLEIPFMRAAWSELPRVGMRLGSFDAAICLGSSLHHADSAGVDELFLNIGSVLNPSGKFIVEQRNYESLFRERPTLIDHPCGWRYTLDYPDAHTVVFHLEDDKRGLNTSTATTITFEHEVLQIAKGRGYALCEQYFDYGKHSDREQSWWIQYVFERFS
jgi:SAM-dependent methyltransferase